MILKIKEWFKIQHYFAMPNNNTYRHIRYCWWKTCILKVFFFFQEHVSWKFQKLTPFFLIKPSYIINIKLCAGTYWGLMFTQSAIYMVIALPSNDIVLFRSLESPDYVHLINLTAAIKTLSWHFLFFILKLGWSISWQSLYTSVIHLSDSVKGNHRSYCLFQA